MALLDKEIKAADVQSINSADQLAAFFSMLGYDTNTRVVQTPDTLGISAEGTVRPIQKIELISKNGEARPLHVILFELSSVTMTHTRELARAFRNKQGEFLLVLTTRDYEKVDFVLVERSTPASGIITNVGQKHVSVHPRVLTVSRRKPETIHLRVIRRFTYTESDELAQYDKLKSAFSIAYWSEEYFNNRALFSDYFLKERLPSERPEWKEDPKPAFVKFRALYAQAASRWGNETEKVLRSALFVPVFEILNFKAVEGKPADSAATEPDYRLYSPAGGEKPLALCLTYRWGRYLDGKDANDTETPDENPGAAVLSLLESGEAPFAIVTNGKYWRLYCSRAHFPAGHYYEIDLEEVLAESGTLANDPAMAFRYFWLIFRGKAFEPIAEQKEGEKRATTFLDALIDGSAEYSKKLGERLKGRVFDQIFPHFSRGFIEYIQAQNGHRGGFSQDDLDSIFHGTLTFLYRLLFLLYAEARDLLPVKEARGYFEKSVSKLKREIGEAGGGILDEAPERLEKTYSAASTAIYDQLTELFTVIDIGDSALNVPVYNGGLFITNPDPDDPTPEAENARFLKNNKIPDRWLALGLDLMARDLDDKTQKLVSIDYKSLGVRHLGSIYEGLLEFRLRIAPEKMAIIKGKKTEEVIPYAEAKKGKQKILTEGRGSNAKERIYEKGEIYLENDRRERKATGSYYTPDYIVKYIVEHTIGPVLEKKFKEIAPKFRNAQKAYNEAIKRRAEFDKRGMKGDDPEKVANTFKHLVPLLFDIKTLDPAMGSGHFLVEAVDFITKQIINFLNGFPWNPVIAHIGETRKTILEEMEKQNVTIDAAKLTDVNLLKRHVLKQCVYGVDLNPMAVELAKVSLWLDCFTLGAPLSFLDHHLKCGNSLVGVEVDKVREALGEADGKALQLGLWGSRFAGLMLATDLMRQVGELSDVTAAQVKASRHQYKQAADALGPFKRILDVYTSQWFGNIPVKKTKGKTTREYNLALEFLKSSEAEKWADNPKLTDNLSETYRDVAVIALESSVEKRFFHWELEFPEVFFAPRKGTTQVIEEKENPGFDAVIGNPPYGTEFSNEEREYFDVSYLKMPNQLNIAGLFVFKALLLSSESGCIGNIIPKSFTFSEGWNSVADAVFNNMTHLIDASKAFEEVLLEQVVFILENSSKNNSYESGIFSREIFVKSDSIDKILRDRLGILPTGLSSDEIRLGVKIISNNISLKDITETTRGLPWQKKISANGELIIAGKDIVRYGLRNNILRFVNYDSGEAEKKIDKLREIKIISQNIVAHIANPSPHIRIISTVDNKGLLTLDTVNNTFITSDGWEHECVVGVINSKLMSWFMYRFIYNQAIRTMHFDDHYVGRLSLPDMTEDVKKALTALVAHAIELKNQSEMNGFSENDAQIDSIVYNSFGLTTKEIMMVERTTFH